MKINLHRWFIPSKKNKFHPVALRPVGLAVFAAIFVALPFVYNVTSAKKSQVLGYASNVTITDLNSLSNAERTSRGIAALNLNSSLNSAAAAKANDMMVKNYWAHVAPDGTTPWAFIAAAGYNYSVAGENLAKDFNTSSGVVAGWMASQLHRDNILNTNYQDVGYAVVNGVLLGSETTLVVAMYGARYTPPQAAAAPAPVQPAPKTTSTPQSTAPAASTPVTQAQPTTTDITKQTEKSGVTAPKTTPTAASQNDNGVVEGISSSLPVRTYNSFNWAQRVSIVLIGTLILLFVMKHTIVWRQQKRGCRDIWLRSHPLSQAAMLAIVMVINLLSSVGVVL